MSKKINHVIAISGKDSLATAIVQTRRQPELEYQYVFCDVGMELPETYAWIDRVEKKLKIKLQRIGRDLEKIIAQVGIIPSFVRRYCTKMAKLEPLKEFMDSFDGKVIQYIGFRFDEKDRIPPPGIERNIAEERYPLIEEMIDLPGVYKLLDEAKVLPPSFMWGRLYDAVYESVGPASKRFIDNAAPWTLSYLFSWRSRSNCFECHYQRLYEWVGLLEHHPELFEKAREIERVFGGARSEFLVYRREEQPYQLKDFHFSPYYSLDEIRKRASVIFADRVKQVRDAVVNGRQNVNEVDKLSSTSCGALCGK